MFPGNLTGQKAKPQPLCRSHVTPFCHLIVAQCRDNTTACRQLQNCLKKAPCKGAEPSDLRPTAVPHLALATSKHFSKASFSDHRIKTQRKAS